MKNPSPRNRYARAVLSLLLLFCASLLPAQAQNALVYNGQPYSQIVISGTPSRMTQYAATELQKYVKKISGAELSIVTTPSVVLGNIYVGESSHTAFLGLSGTGLNDGAYKMVSGYNWLALLGREQNFNPIEPWGHVRTPTERTRVRDEWQLITGEEYETPFYQFFQMQIQTPTNVWEFDEAGTLNAVYAFLHSLGARWYAPDDIGEVMPQMATIMLPLVNETVVPDFAVRDYKLYYQQHGQKAVGPWKLRMGTNPGHRYVGSTQAGHGIKFVLMDQGFKDAYPTAYALKADGVTRDTTSGGTGSPCLSSQILFDKHVKYVRAMFDHYQEQVVSIDMPDGFASLACQCPECVAKYTPGRGSFGNLSDYVWDYINRVAQEVYLTHPDRKVTGLAYGAYQLPPLNIAQMSPNLMVIECRWRSTFHEPTTKQYYTQLRSDWLAKLPSDEYAIWDYYLHTTPGNAGIPAVFPHLIKDDLLQLRGVSRGDLIEVYTTQDAETTGYPAFALNHLNLYVTSRLWWDADTNVDLLLEEYYELYYGPAENEMRAFIQHCEATWTQMRTNPTPVNQAITLLQAARAAAPVGSIYSERIEKIADQYIQPMTSLSQSLIRYNASLPSYRVLYVSEATGGLDMNNKPLNGILDPAYWPNVRTGSLARFSGTSGTPGATVNMFTGNNKLYMGIKCLETNMAGLTITGTGNGDPAILNGDYISIMFETPTRSYYEIVVNPAGSVLQIDHGPDAAANWTAGMQVAVNQGVGQWSIELRIPFYGEGARLVNPSVGIDGNMPRTLAPWYVNVFRQRINNGVTAKQALYLGSPATFRNVTNLAHMYVKN